jgi:hypothetical protein
MGNAREDSRRRKPIQGPHMMRTNIRLAGRQ